MIEKSELAAIAKSLGATVREYVAAAVVGFLTRDQLEERLKQLPIPQKGEKGDAGIKGDKGEQGERGLSGENGRDGERGPAGFTITGPKGDKGDPGERGENGLTVIGPKGEKGDSGERGAQGEQGYGIPGERGERGEKGDPGTDGRDGREGKDGRDGIDGKDATEIRILSSMPEKHPAIGTWIKYLGGLWRYNGGDGRDGWDCIIDGIRGVNIQQSEDFRKLVIKVHLSSGGLQEQEFKLPVMLFRDIFKDGNEYFMGDVVVADNSSWHCQVESTKARPGVSPDWRLMARKGTSGKDGKNGERGPQGPEGKPGRDARMAFETSR